MEYREELEATMKKALEENKPELLFGIAASVIVDIRRIAEALDALVRRTG